MESDNNQSSVVPKVVGSIVAVIVCCACILILTAGWVIYRAYQDLPGIPTSLPTGFVPPSDSPTPPPAPTIAPPTMDVTAP